MELRLSNLAKTYPASGIRKMFDLAAGYDDVIALTLGELWGLAVLTLVR